LAATAAAASSPAGAQLLEQQMQTLFFEARGIVAPPKDIVILAIDEASLSQAGQFFRGDPQQYADLEAIQAWPWQRSAYGTVVDRLMAAGAKAVAIDVIFSTPSSYGEADDQKFAQILQQHSQVVLAAQYSQLETPQGIGTQISTPLSEFCPDSSCLGFINFFLEPDGRIHRLGEQFLTHLNQSSPPDQAEALEQFPAFATSTLNAAQIQYPRRSGDSIFFYGPAQTFEQIPFWLVLDSNTWKANFQSGAYFKDKIV
jgi:CHASE2 domain-containing sensor protein